MRAIRLPLVIRQPLWKGMRRYYTPIILDHRYPTTILQVQDNFELDLAHYL